MQTIGINIKKTATLSLLMIYMVVSLSNLSYLPKYNTHQTGNETRISAGGQFLPAWLYNGANSSSILFHRTCKTIIENRRNLAAFFKAAASVFLLLMTGGFGGLFMSNAISNVCRQHLSGRLYASLNFCVLRI